MNLYYHPISLFSHKVIMALEEKGLSYTLNQVDFTNPQSREAYRALYPLGKVPVLQLGNHVLGESTSIIEWLEVTYPEVPLIPEHSALEIRRLDRLLDNYIAANISLLFFQSLKPESKRDLERTNTAKRQLGVVLAEFEQIVGQNNESEFAVGGGLTLVDVGLIPALTSVGQLVPLDTLPRLQQYLALHQQRPSLLKARENFEVGLANMVKVMTA